MPETHINAYFEDVQVKQVAANVANAELEAAKIRLEDKKKADGYEEPKPESKPKERTADKPKVHKVPKRK